MATPVIVPFPSASTDIGTTVTRYSTLPSPADMKRRSLFGIPLKSTFTGETVEDQTLQDYIDESISEVEHELDLYISPVTFTERQDFNREMQFWSFGYLKLNHSPILQVNSFSVTFNNGAAAPPLISIPTEFVHVQSQEGTVQLVPAMGVSISGYVASIYSSLGFQLFDSTMMTQWPGAITVEYVVGFPDDKVPALLVSLIENLAAYKFLSTLGPILFPYSSVGLGIDGVSQSTSTPGPAFLQQRLSELEKLIQTQKEAARGHYQKRFLLDYL